jgi:large subunit ribosomal protein L35
VWPGVLSLPSLKIEAMPKMKTNSSAKKRFSLTGTGKVKRKKAFKRHILTKKEHAQKERLGKTVIVSSADMKRVKKMLLI